MENKTPGRYEKLLNMTSADLGKDRLGVPICESCNGSQWINGLDEKEVRCPRCTPEIVRARIVMEFLDAIETTEIITADGSDRDVDPEGFGFSIGMMDLIVAIAEDDNDVWNNIARRLLDSASVDEEKTDGETGTTAEARQQESESEGRRDF